MGNLDSESARLCVAALYERNEGR